MSKSLVEFLLDRIDDDADSWRWFAAEGDHTWGPHGRRHMAECEAKLDIVAFAKHLPGAYMRCVLEPMARVYEDHPDYQQEWKL